MTEGALAGFTVAVTAERRRGEMTALLERRGARVVSAPAITIVPLIDDDALRAATEACIGLEPHLVVATTGFGFRGWLEAAEGWGLAETLREALRAAKIIARGPKPCGAIRAAGLSEDWAAKTEASEEVLERLLHDGVAGRKIVVQEHGEPQTEFVNALRAAGAAVVEVPVYRWALPADTTPVRRLAEQVAAGQIDAVTFTSAPAVKAFLQIAGETGVDVPAAFRDGTLAACVGPVTAAPLVERDVPVVMPERFRLGALIKTVTDELPRRAVRLRVAGTTLEVRGHAVLIDGAVHALAPAAMAILASLARRPGAVVSKEQLAAALPRGNDGHAVDVAVARLRAALGSGRHIETVIKRGYRLRVDEAA
ncbi:uroporphyrinogen III synthetase [Actinoplanes sp. SE50]|uniref:uroporphyrinogen-III synthase n=1 Tax=unclassified Actinoplanes TaxID=2626549 RepID=UPI00023EBD15|nr:MULTISPECIES: uroporphyrinogen-III synthase [unclassified Actinoplanes]AEV83462.1 uroporphyrinogen-III synthase [Actinoplanes sp. SE50/110]ATO81855.1 uroporphyrinogen III synthetase [Actinoplanes sp. SE50]SLL99263.1 bifunctional uroporphyrinogen-III synthetase/response regulator domain-containing protein [Actinoplanes sp. SE50/110]